MLDQKLLDVARFLGIDPSTLPPIVVREPAANDYTVEEPSIENNDLSDEEYALLVPFLPVEPKHGAAITNRQVLLALLWSQTRARPLTHVPRSYGSAEAIRKRAERWAVLGVGAKLEQGIDGLPLGPYIKAAIKRLAGDLTRRGERINKARASLR